MLKNAIRLNGLTSLVITKLDVLKGLKELKICTGYKYKEEIREDFPASLKELADCEPVYTTLPGWEEDISGIKKMEDLPEKAINYLKYIEKFVEVPLHIISVGPQREQTIIIKNDFEMRP